jgi:hypothetical protein
MTTIRRHATTAAVLLGTVVIVVAETAPRLSIR